MTTFTQILPSVCTFWHDGRDCYGVIRGHPYDGCGPGLIVESEGVTHTLRYMHDHYMMYQPRDKGWSEVMAAIIEQENNQ